MAGLPPLEQRLKFTFSKRMDKLKKLRRRMRRWSAAGALCAVAASVPLVYFLFTGNLPAISFDPAPYVSGGWAAVIGMVAVGLLGSMVFYGQLKREKDKFDKIRVGAVALLQSRESICECKWAQCSCKDEIIREMSDKYDINLSF
jgi:hypothetical protein